MARTNPLGVRVEPEIKEALERAAKDDDRSVSSMVERILKAWLVDKGYLGASTSVSGVDSLDLNPIAGADHQMARRDRSDK
jgi:hypothetical protein